MIKKNNDAYVYRFECSKDWVQPILLISDVHFDSFKCDRKLLKKHLDEAKALGARILIFGDWFDCMGGKYDPRTTKADIRPEYQTQTYFQDIILDSAAFLAPYAHLIDLICDGNHETSVKLRKETNLLGEDLGLCGVLNNQYGAKCFNGKYAGFIRFGFVGNGTTRASRVLYWTHGGGGNSPVTKGAIKTNRRQEAIVADYYVSGHIHTEFEMVRPRSYLSQSNNVITDAAVHWQLPTYKNDFLGGGWEDHKECPAANLGGRWLYFNWRGDKPHHKSMRTDNIM